MTPKPTVLGVVTARAGSKGIPGKNTRRLAGKPLIAYTIESALASGVFDRLILSTDDEEAARIARELGCEVPFIRPRGVVRGRHAASARDAARRRLDARPPRLRARLGDDPHAHVAAAPAVSHCRVGRAGAGVGRGFGGQRRRDAGALQPDARGDDRRGWVGPAAGRRPAGEAPAGASPGRAESVGRSTVRFTCSAPRCCPIRTTRACTAIGLRRT